MNQFLTEAVRLLAPTLGQSRAEAVVEALRAGVAEENAATRLESSARGIEKDMRKPKR